MRRIGMSIVLSTLLAGGLSTGCTLELNEADGGKPSSSSAAVTSASKSQGLAYYGSERMSADYSVAHEAGLLGEGDLTVLMVVDRSGSMDAPWDGSTKWQIARTSLNSAIVGVEEQVTIGALFFPSGQADSCTVASFEDPAQIHLQKGALFQEELGAMSDLLGGGTPLYLALLEADDVVTQAVLDGALERRMRVVIVTDGEPNCSGTEAEMFEIADGWREMGVDVRVMGLPGSETASRFLNRLAGKEVDEAAPYVPPPTVVDTTSSGSDTGYVAPQTSGDVDDSAYAVVR